MLRFCSIRERRNRCTDPSSAPAPARALDTATRAAAAMVYFRNSSTALRGLPPAPTPPHTHAHTGRHDAAPVVLTRELSSGYSVRAPFSDFRETEGDCRTIILKLTISRPRSLLCVKKISRKLSFRFYFESRRTGNSITRSLDRFPPVTTLSSTQEQNKT